MIKTFKDIRVWEKTHGLVLTVYKVTAKFPEEEKYCLSNQLRRASISIPSNIVEGFRRNTKKDRNHFYVIANGSLEEVKYQLLLAKDLRYINDLNYEELVKQMDEVGKMLSAWIKSQS
ncbi:MAG TPA: four helix bundle protein [Candidatus Paceibacterota bacterium]|nr:four helix bundle protein [Candidatus Pacearchaeota archaeon]HRZ50682.1 four helix bundle protein [Candidatus Paceibacterota bacterium]HSA36421.1 four helix bundle protein [Candidatus Paceibacterota bacterium]